MRPVLGTYDIKTLLDGLRRLRCDCQLFLAPPNAVGSACAYSDDALLESLPAHCGDRR